jgi:hypothetical protein
VIETLRKMLAEATPGPWRTAKLAADGPHLVIATADDEAGDMTIAQCRCALGMARANAALIAAAVNTLPALLDAAEAWRDYLSAQRTIEESGHMDNYTDAARARKRQAKAIDRARRALAALGVGR